MSQKIPNIDCIAYERGICFNNHAPKTMWMRPECILIQTKDPRTVKQCNLQVPWPGACQAPVSSLTDQETLGVEFEAVWDTHVDSLYEN